jgi:hypothetical protein
MTRGLKSSLRSIAHLSQDADPERAFHLQRTAFHKTGIVCLSLADVEARLGWAAARELRTLGERIFGKDERS